MAQLHLALHAAVLDHAAVTDPDASGNWRCKSCGQRLYESTEAEMAAQIREGLKDDPTAKDNLYGGERWDTLTEPGPLHAAHLKAVAGSWSRAKVMAKKKGAIAVKAHERRKAITFGEVQAVLK